MIMRNIYCLNQYSEEPSVAEYKTQHGTIAKKIMKYNCVAKTGHNTDIILEDVNLFDEFRSKSFRYLQINQHDSA